MRPFTLMRWLALICLGLIATRLTAQTSNPDGSTDQPPPEPVFKIFDRFGSEYDLEDIQIPQNTALAGMFRLHFADEDMGTGDGFDHPTTGANRRAVLIRVFEDLSNLLGGFPATSYPNLSAGTCNLSETFPTCRHIEIDVRESVYDPNQSFAGRASSYYKTTGRPEINSGVVWQYINTGWDPWHLYPYGTQSPTGAMPMSVPNPVSYGHYHGHIQFNWDLVGGFDWNENPLAVPTSSEIDLYSVALHEALHILGIHSMINDQSLSQLSLTNPGVFSHWDLHLKQNAGSDLLNFDLDAGDCWTATSQAPQGLAGSACTTNPVQFHDAGNGITHEVYKDNPYAPGSALSHFNCVSATGWVMNASGSGGYVQRFPNSTEYKALCALGYDLSGTYGTGATGATLYPLISPNITHSFQSVSYQPGSCAATHLIAASDDFGPHANDANYLGVGPTWDISSHWSCPLGGSVTLLESDIIANDPHAISVPCLPEVVIGGGTVIPVGGGFQYDPAPNYFGVAVLRYRSANVQGQRSNTAYLFVQVAPPPCQFTGTCDENLVCLGDFEAIPACHLAADPVNPQGRYRNFLPGAPGNNSPHLFPSACNFTTSQGCTGSHSCPTTNSFNCSGPDTVALNVPNNAVPGSSQFGGIAASLSNAEILTFDLTRPLDNGCHRIEFWAATGCNLDLNFVFTDNRPCNTTMLFPQVNVTTNCPGQGTSYTPKHIETVSLPGQLNGIQLVWNQYVVNIPNASVQGCEFLTIYGTPVSPNGQMIYVDNIELYDCDQQDVVITTQLDNPYPCPGDTFNISYTVQNNGAAITSPIDLQADLGSAAGALQVVSGGGFNANGLATLNGLPAGGSATVTLSVELTNLAAVGSSYCVGLVIPSGPCINGSAVQDCVTLGTATLEMNKEVLSTGPYGPGSPVVYQVTIENVSQFQSVTGVVMEDELPASVNFVSATGMGTYNAVDHTYTGTSVSLSPGQTLTWTISTVLDQGVSCGPVSNCAVIAAGTPFCGPDSDCEIINVIQQSAGPYSATVTPPSCHGACDGSITVSPGPVSNVFYSLLNPPGCFGPPALQLNPVLSPVSAGTYTVEVFDGNTGCSQQIQVTVTEPPPLTATYTATQPLCAGDCDGEILISASGGAGAYVFLNGAGNPISNPWTGLCGNTSYPVQVVDVSGCSLSLFANLYDPPSLFVNGSTTPETCGGSCDGALTAVITGGTANPNYTWEHYPPGWISPNQTGTTTGMVNLTNLCGGAHLLRVLDGNNCQQDYYFMIGGPDPINIQMNTTHESCPNSNDGQVAAAITGGLPALTFTWSGPNGFSASGVGLSVITNLVPGTYSLTLTDGTGCTATQSTVVNSAVPLNATFTVLEPIECHDDCNGTVQINATGGTTPYTYTLIQLPNGQLPISLPGNLIANACPGNYVMMLIDANGCTAQFPYTLFNPPTLAAAAIPLDPTCTGVCDGAANILASGGVTPYSYSLNANGPFSTSPLSGLCGNQTYTAYVKDAVGCTVDITFTLTDPTPVGITTNLIQHETCLGQCDGALQVTGTGGTPPYVFNVNGGPNINAVNLSNLCAGNYDVQITDANGCTTGISYLINPGVEDTWPKEPASIGSDRGHAEDLAQVEGSDDYYLTGWFRGAISFTDLNGNAINLTATGGPGDEDVFVAKYDECGIVWAYGFGSPNFDDRGFALRYHDNTDRLYLGGVSALGMAGYTQPGSTASLLPQNATNTIMGNPLPLSSNLGQKGYVMEIDPTTGNPGWVWIAGNLQNQASSVREISIYQNQLLVGLDFQGDFQLNNGPIFSSVANSWDINLVSLTIAGLDTGIEPFGTDGDDGCRGLKAYTRGGGPLVVMTGFVNGNGTFSQTPITTTGEDVFLAQYNGHVTPVASGQISVFGGPGDDRGLDLDCYSDVSSNLAMGIFVTGRFETGIGIAGVNYIANGSHDAFVLGCDWGFSQVWADIGGGPGHEDAGTSITLGPNNGVYVGGYGSYANANAGFTGFLTPYTGGGNGVFQEMFVVGFDQLTGNVFFNGGLNTTTGNGNHSRLNDVECANNYIYTCGSLGGSYYFDGVWFGNQSSDYEAYYARMDYTGSYQPRLDVDTPAVESVAEGNRVEVFPNPTAGEFTVRWDVEGARQLEVRDINGRLVEVRDLQDGIQQRYLDLSAEAQGVYLVRLITDGGVETVRLVVGR